MSAGGVSESERKSEGERENCSCSQVRRKCVSWGGGRGGEAPNSAAIRPTLAIPLPLPPFFIPLAHTTLHGNEVCGSRRCATRGKANEERHTSTVIPRRVRLTG